jgi:phenylacetic acid degradation operon negative regulatory protein
MKSLSNAKKLLLCILDTAIDENLFLTKKSIYSFGKRLSISDLQIKSSIQNLKNQGLVSIKEDGFLISSKALKRKSLLRAERGDWQENDWDGYWRVVIFDIPEKMRSKRNQLRSLLKRKGFVKLQNSVFVSPYANFNMLGLVRSELKIDKYVNFLISKSASTDDDSRLRRVFGLE